MADKVSKFHVDFDIFLRANAAPSFGLASELSATPVELLQSAAAELAAQLEKERGRFGARCLGSGRGGGREGRWLGYWRVGGGIRAGRAELRRSRHRAFLRVCGKRMYQPQSMVPLETQLFG